MEDEILEEIYSRKKEETQEQGEEEEGEWGLYCLFFSLWFSMHWV